MTCPQGLTVFQMKKRSSNHSWIFWTVWVAITLSLSVFIVKYRSFSIRTRIPLVLNLKIPTLANPIEKNSGNLSENTPVFIVFKEKVIYTNFKQFKNPTKDQSVSIPFSILHPNWLSLSKNFLIKKNINLNFNTTAIGILFDNNRELKSFENIYKLINLSYSLLPSNTSFPNLLPVILSLP